MGATAQDDTQRDPVSRIGEAAGQVWRHLNDNSSASLAALPKKLGMPRDLAMQAIGWLAREEKLEISESRRTKSVSLRR